ncbi:MAG TPA: hypothetical protein VHX66_00305 [Solirubrobacteraceae bacterium]|nr:hypothetical protein [Solirubrobacteraceae bacterium]
MKRKKAVIIGLLAGALICAGVAVAYVALFSGVNGGMSGLIVGNGAGTGDSQTQAAVTIVATPTGAATGGGTCAVGNFGDGCTEGFTLAATNDDTTDAAGETLNTLTAPTVAVDATHAAAGCLASWFTWNFGSGDSSPAKHLAEGATNVSFGDSGNGLTFTNSTTTAQTACQGASLTLTFSGTTTPS